MHTWNGILDRSIYSEFENAPVIVLGGGNGIGSAIADAFHFLGARVGIVDKDFCAATRMAECLESRAGTHAGANYFSPRVFPADLAIETDRDRTLDIAVRELGPPKVVISTTGCDTRFAIDCVSQAELEYLVAVNGIAPILATRRLLLAMRNGGGGAVCIFTSRHTTEITEPNALGYAGAKGFLEIGIRSLAKVAGAFNSSDNIIRVFGFCPGWVQTPSQQARYTPEAFAHGVGTQLIPLDTEAQDLVPSVIHLCSKNARRFSGRIHFEDCGEGRLAKR